MLRGVVLTKQRQIYEHSQSLISAEWSGETRFNSAIGFHAQVETLREQLGVLEDGLNKSKVACRAALDSIGIGKEYVDDMIKGTELHPQKNPHLQRVYRSWQKLKEKLKEIRDAEQPYDDFESERKNPER